MLWPTPASLEETTEKCGSKRDQHSYLRKGPPICQVLRWINLVPVCCPEFLRLLWYAEVQAEQQHPYPMREAAEFSLLAMEADLSISFIPAWVNACR